MRNKGDLYEYNGSYVDDLAIAAKDPKEIIEELQNKHNFKLKPRRYIEEVIETCERLFGIRPSGKFHAPLEKGDHPEMDASDLLHMRTEALQATFKLFGQ